MKSQDLHQYVRDLSLGFEHRLRYSSRSDTSLGVIQKHLKREAFEGQHTPFEPLNNDWSYFQMLEMMIRLIMLSTCGKLSCVCVCEIVWGWIMHKKVIGTSRIMWMTQEIALLQTQMKQLLSYWRAACECDLWWLCLGGGNRSTNRAELPSVIYRHTHTHTPRPHGKTPSHIQSEVTAM